MGRKPPHKRNLASRSTNPNRFVQLPFLLLRSLAWQDLSHPARSLYVCIKMRYNSINNGYISFSIREAAEILKAGKNTASKLFQELTEHGFIRPQTKGSFHLKSRHATEWVLTEYGFPDTAPPTKEFMRWKGDAASQLR